MDTLNEKVQNAIKILKMAETAASIKHPTIVNIQERSGEGAFGFNKDVALNDIEFWHILLGKVEIAVIPSSKGWWVRISGENYVSVQVCNIHDIQQAMRVAGITKELEYKEKQTV